MWDALRLDVRHSFRSLRRAPTFSLIVVVTLALAVGATTAVGSLLNALVLRTLAVPIVAHSEQRANHPSLRGNISSPDKIPMPEPIPAHGLAAAVFNSEKISPFLELDVLPFCRRHPYNSASFG